MPKSLILNPSQAEAVYTAMCHQNNVSGTLSATLPGGVRVEECHDGSIQVWTLDTMDRPERYASQANFATAYGMNEDAAPASAFAYPSVEGADGNFYPMEG